MAAMIGGILAQQGILLEYRRDKTLENTRLVNSVIYRLNQDTGWMSPDLKQLLDDYRHGDIEAAYVMAEFLNEIESEDPTSNKKYVETLINWYVKGKIARLEDVIALKSYLEIFSNPQFIAWVRRMNREGFNFRFPFYFDINQYQYLSEFKKIIDHYYDIKEDRDNEEFIVDKHFIKRVVEHPGIRVVYNSGDSYIVSPKELKASKLVASATDWCTANSNMFNHYTSQGPLYVLLTPEKERYQIHFPSMQFMDERDRESILQEMSRDHPALVGWFNGALELADYVEDLPWNTEMFGKMIDIMVQEGVMFKTFELSYSELIDLVENDNFQRLFTEDWLLDVIGSPSPVDSLEIFHAMPLSFWQKNIKHFETFDDLDDEEKFYIETIDNSDIMSLISQRMWHNGVKKMIERIMNDFGITREGDLYIFSTSFNFVDDCMLLHYDFERKLNNIEPEQDAPLEQMIREELD